MKSTVKDVMTRKVVVVRDSAPFKQVVRVMDEFRVSAVPVVDAEGKLVGILSEADLLLKEELPPLEERLFVGRRRRAERTKASGLTAAQVMTRDVVTVSPDATLAQAARLMHSKGVKRLPVVGEGGSVLGIVSRADLLKIFLRSDEEIERNIVRDVIERTLWIDRSALTVEVREGVVSLSGQLERRSLAPILTELVRAVDGVVGVDDRLSWEVDDVTSPGDFVNPWGIYAGALRP
jgi:CBS domain-containing protein